MEWHVPGWRLAAAAVLFVGLGAALPAGAANLFAPAAPGCPVGTTPRFEGGLQALRAQLNGTMGEPLECARREQPNGDLLQRTTTGLAYVRQSTGLPSFTDGSTHWALTATGLLSWRGGWHASLDPPAPVPADPATTGLAVVPEPGTYARVEAVRLQAVLDADGRMLLVRRDGGGPASEVLLVAEDCAGISGAVGQNLFVVSPAGAPFAAEGARVLAFGRGECAVVARQAPLAADLSASSP